MSFEQPSIPQERAPESIREILRSKIEAVNELQAKAASLDIDEIDFRPEAIDAQAGLVADLFVAAEDEPETMLELAQAIKDAETRWGLTGKAVVRIGASGDATAFEGALEKHKEVLRAIGWQEELVERGVEGLRRDVVEKRIEHLLETGDVPAAVKAYVQEYEGSNSALKNRVEGSARSFVMDAPDLPRRIENYAQLPDRYPGMGENDFTMDLYRQANAELPPETDWEVRQAHLEARFAQAPDILARISINHYFKGWNQEDRLRLFKKVRDAGERASVLSGFLDHDFSAEGYKEVKPDLFAAYLKFKPENILDRIREFREPFEALPDAEREALLDRWIEEEPEMLAYRLEFLPLDENRFNRLLDRLLEQAPQRLLDGPFMDKMALTVHQAVEYAVKTGQARPLLRFGVFGHGRGLSDETLALLVNGCIGTDPGGAIDHLPNYIHRGGEFEPEAVQKGLEKLFSARNFIDLAALESGTHARLDVGRLSEQTLRGIQLTDIGTILESYPELSERLAMAGIVGKLEKIQGRAARAEHDVWEQELDPLLAKAYADGILSPEKHEDAELFLEFVKEFGAVNTPKLFETYVGLKRAKTVEEIPDGVRKMLEETLGKKRVEKMKTPAFLLNEIRKFDRGMVSALLEDKIPAGMTSELGLELFDQKKGASNWEQDHDPKELIAKLEAFRAESPERAAVPEGYVETRMTVPLMERGGKDRRVSAILERPEVRESFAAYGERLRYSHVHSWENDGLIQDFIEAHPEATGFIDAAQLPPDQGKYGLGELAGMMEALRADESADAAKLLARLSAEHARIAAPQGRAQAFWDLVTDDPPEAQDIRRMRDLLVDYISEHYLHPAQETHRTGHEPFSPELRAALEKVWGLADKDANPVIKAFNDMEALKKSGKRSAKSKDVALVPAQGLLRVYGGDIADACYTSRHDELAEGKYPDLHAMIFVTGRGTASERFAGSVLFVETETPPEAGSKKVLMVRANNPRENLIQDVDADALVRQTLDEAIATAKRRGLDMVVVPLDEASTSSSNRPAVSQYYQENFSDAESVALQRRAETNFNGYPNFDPDSGHGVVVVWSREEEEKEPG